VRLSSGVQEVNCLYIQVRIFSGIRGKFDGITGAGFEGQSSFFTKEGDKACRFNNGVTMTSVQTVGFVNFELLPEVGFQRRTGRLNEWVHTNTLPEILRVRGKKA